MARGGIYKSQVLRARDNLLAQGLRPSIDALRIELGNTGSKSTIHRFLKEIEEEEGGRSGRTTDSDPHGAERSGTVGGSAAAVAVEESLQNLVTRLSQRLQEEAEKRLTEQQAVHDHALQQVQGQLQSLQAEKDALEQRFNHLSQGLDQERQQHAHTQEQLSAAQLQTARHMQEILGLREQLQVQTQHSQSLEEKHQHAQRNLEHFRQAAKEQREQQTRQHEQQVQYLQSEIRTLGQSLTQISAARSTSKHPRKTTDAA